MKGTRSLKQLLSSSYHFIVDIIIYVRYKAIIRNMMRKHNISNSIVKGEDIWYKRWKKLYRIDISEYRLYAKYVDETKRLDIVPEAALHGCIERILNPYRFRSFYSDKNSYDLFLSKGSMPKTILRGYINSDILFDCDYKPVDIDSLYNRMFPYERIIIKPSVDSSSGKGVEVLYRIENGNYLISSINQLFSGEWLKTMYSKGFIMQECLSQSQFFSQFNDSSVNTLRICVYKSVVDGIPYVTSAFLRIGKSGEYKDNAHAGGRFVGVNVDTGLLGNYVCDQYGDRTNVFNGIDFAANSYYIPNWSEILDFSKEIVSKFQHNNLFALDVMVDADNKPRLIEANFGGFGVWAFLMSNLSVFGGFTDEIIDYCYAHKDELYYKKQLIS